MFIHRNFGRHARAVSLGILAVALAAGATRAAELSDPLVMVAYSNRAGGEHLAGGAPVSAAQLTPRQAGLALADPQATDTNRCVALAMTHQLAAARSACDAAVHAAQDPDANGLSWEPRARQRSAAAAAVAYSNRAVVRWMESEPAAARQDLARAQALAPQSDFVVRNLSAMQTRQTADNRTTATAALAAAQ
jgi:hypothetical protein